MPKRARWYHTCKCHPFVFAVQCHIQVLRDGAYIVMHIALLHLFLISCKCLPWCHLSLTFLTHCISGEQETASPPPTIRLWSLQWQPVITADVVMLAPQEAFTKYWGQHHGIWWEFKLPKIQVQNVVSNQEHLQFRLPMFRIKCSVLVWYFIFPRFLHSAFNYIE